MIRGKLAFLPTLLGMLLLGALLPGCAEELAPVQMTGTVWDGPDALSAVGGASLEVYDRDYHAFSTATANPDGSFSVSVPAGASFYLFVGAEGYTATGWSGFAGLEDYSGGDDVPWVASAAWMDTLYADWAGCPGVDEPGAMVVGQIRLAYPYLLEGVAGEGATAEVIDADGATHAACYRDDDGEADPEATLAGPDGLFAVFGVPSGVSWLVVSFLDQAGNTWTEEYISPAPPDGLVPFAAALIPVEDG